MKGIGSKARTDDGYRATCAAWGMPAYATVPCVYVPPRADGAGWEPGVSARADAITRGLLAAARARRATSERAAVLCENYRWFR